MISFYYFCDQTVINQLPTKNVNFVLYWIYSKGFPNWCVPYESTDQMKTWQIDLHPSPSKSSTNPMLQVTVGFNLGTVRKALLIQESQQGSPSLKVQMKARF